MTIDKLLDALTTCGWYVWDDFLSSSSIAEIKAAIPEDALQAARIGHQSSSHLSRWLGAWCFSYRKPFPMKFYPHKPRVKASPVGF